MSSYMELMEKIRINPSYFFGYPTLSKLYAFLLGYETALLDKGECEKFREIKDFQIWISEKYLMDLNWVEIILYHSYEERTAFDRFWELWDEFLQD